MFSSKIKTPAPTKVLTKTSSSTNTDTGIHHLIQARDKTQIIITGKGYHRENVFSLKSCR